MVTLARLREIAEETNYLTFTISLRGKWLASYKGYTFDVATTEEALMKDIEKAKRHVEALGDDSHYNSASLQRVRDYEFTNEDVKYLTDLYDECEEEAAKELKETLLRVGYKECLGIDELERIFKLGTLEEVKQGLKDYVGYLKMGDDFRLLVLHDDDYVDSFSLLKETLNLFDFFEFKETIKAANLRYLYDLENDNENALQRFNDLIKVRFPDLTFPSFSYFNIYVKTKNNG